MKLSIDARGLACPQPVIKTKKALEEEGVTQVEIVVDNPAARDNVSRFARNAGFAVESVTPEGEDFRIIIVEQEALDEEVQSPNQVPRVMQLGGKVVFIGSDVIGGGSDELGTKLMKAFCYALTEISVPPRQLIFMNAGVKLCVEGSDALGNLQTLAERGVDMLVCGTCLDFFGLSNVLKVGKVSNMYDIAEQLLGEGSVVRI
jgi:selenium metabolism protein YedF